jgi:hypothetical protein
VVAAGRGADAGASPGADCRWTLTGVVLPGAEFSGVAAPGEGVGAAPEGVVPLGVTCLAGMVAASTLGVGAPPGAADIRCTGGRGLALDGVVPCAAGEAFPAVSLRRAVVVLPPARTPLLLPSVDADIEAEDDDVVTVAPPVDAAARGATGSVRRCTGAGPVRAVVREVPGRDGAEPAGTGVTLTPAVGATDTAGASTGAVTAGTGDDGAEPTARCTEDAPMRAAVPEAAVPEEEAAGDGAAEEEAAGDEAAAPDGATGIPGTVTPDIEVTGPPRTTGTPAAPTPRGGRTRSGTAGARCTTGSAERANGMASEGRLRSGTGRAVPRPTASPSNALDRPSRTEWDAVPMNDGFCHVGSRPPNAESATPPLPGLSARWIGGDAGQAAATTGCSAAVSNDGADAGAGAATLSPPSEAEAEAEAPRPRSRSRNPTAQPSVPAARVTRDAISSVNRRRSWCSRSRISSMLQWKW